MLMPGTEAVTRACDGTKQVGLMIDTGYRFVLGSADGHHQRQQMLFARMRETRGRRLRPVKETIGSFDRGRLHQRLEEPCIELLRGLLSPAVQALQVVIAHATADDQHALITQRRQQPARFQMSRGIQIRVE